MSEKKLLIFLVLALLLATLAFTAPRPGAPPTAQQAEARNGYGPEKPFYLADLDSTSRPLPSYNPMLDCSSNYMRGDFNGNEFLDFDDAVLLINCIYINPNGRLCLVCIGDMNCDKNLTATDVVILFHLILYPPEFDIHCPN